MTMTIHAALAELKTIDSRIERAATVSKVATNTNSAPKILGVTVEKFAEDAKASWQSVTDLMARRMALKNAVAASNASTKVTIAGKEMTVAAAIEMRKTGLGLYKQVLTILSAQYELAQRTMTRANDTIDAKADDFVTRLFGSKEKGTGEEARVAREAYIKANTVNLIDPINAQAEIAKLADFIDATEAELDAALSVSNAITLIEI